jgi:hypothetical protein
MIKLLLGWLRQSHPDKATFTAGDIYLVGDVILRALPLAIYIKSNINNHGLSIHDYLNLLLNFEVIS